jgi:hypothetical protein
MANTLILVDRLDYPIRKVTATLVWRGGGYSRVWVDDSGRGQFNGTGIVITVRIPGEDLDVYKTVNGSTTVVAKSDRNH